MSTLSERRGESSAQTGKPIFRFKAEDHREEWGKRGYLHIADGVSAGFFEYMSESIAAQLQSREGELRDWKIAAKKSQHLFEFDSKFDFAGLYESVSALTGLDKERLTLCERHVKVYDESADPYPVPHKDRLASEVVIGLPVCVPDDSYLALYPEAPQTENPFQSTARWRRLLSTPDQTRQALDQTDPVRLYGRPGDVLIFRGSRIFHERINGAGSILLFLKFNAMRMDPLGEDPSTPYLESRTARIFPELGEGELLDAAIEVSPRLEKVASHFHRRDWSQVYLASLWNEDDIHLEETEFEIIRALDRGQRSGRSILKEFRELDRSRLCSTIRTLCQKKLIVLPNLFPYQGVSAGGE